MAKEVKIEVLDKVCVEFNEGPFTGIVQSIDGKKGTIAFDDGSSEDCLLSEMKLIRKGGEEEADNMYEQDDPKKKTPAASPNAQQLEKKATVNRKARVDAFNKANTAEAETKEKANAGKAFTAEEKSFMVDVESKLDKGRQVNMPLSSAMTRYARLVRQRDGG